MGVETIWGIGIGYLLINYIMNNMPTKYSLKKIKKSGILSEPIKLDEVNPIPLDECLRFGENDNIIRDFYSTLEDKLSHCDLSAFHANMKDLRIYSSKDSFLLKLLDALAGTRTGGAYLSKKNKIHIDDQPFGRSQLKRNILTHELLHMASTRKDKDFIYSGFHISGKKLSIGEGINEGYTELLNGRYFGNPRSSDSYFDLQMLSSGIETIVGQENMEKMYFSNNLNGLIEALGRYISKDEAIGLIAKMDSLLKKKTRTDSKQASKLFDEIKMDIAGIRLRQLKMQKDNGELSERDYINSIYSLELYLNGYVAFKMKNDSGMVVNNCIARGPLLKFRFIELTPDEFNQHADNFYKDFVDNGLYEPDSWKNRFGISTKKMIETRFSAARNEKINKFRKGHSSKSSELREMFDTKEEVKKAPTK